MKWWGVAAAAALGWALSAPAGAQFYMQTKPMADKPAKGDEPGILATPLPGATPAELQAAVAWTMRAGLNVAALQCQFEPTLTPVRNYNALLADHKDELKKAFDTLGKYFARTSKTKAEGQTKLDQFGTRTYSAFSTVTSQYGFCSTAHALGRDADFAPRGHFGEFSEEHIRELRNSLVPYGEQRLPAYAGFGQYVSAPLPRLDPQCWSKKGDWQERKCGPLTWPPQSAAVSVASGAGAGVGIAAR